MPDDDAFREEMAQLQGEVRRLDEGVGALLDAVEEAGLTRDTVVVFVGDNGLPMPRAKCTLYDAGIEAALIMSWPGGKVRGGRVENGLLSNIDVLPTLLEASGIPIPRNIQGRSFLSLARGDDYTTANEVFMEKTIHDSYDPMRSIRTDRFKFIRWFEVGPVVNVPTDIRRGAAYRAFPILPDSLSNPQYQLFDLAADPNEQQDLSRKPEYEQVVDELDTRLRNWMEETEDPLLQGPVGPSPPYRTG